VLAWTRSSPSASSWRERARWKNSTRAAGQIKDPAWRAAADSNRLRRQKPVLATTEAG
jgi:hypothetical protein